MDEEEISVRIDARGRAAGASTHRALAAEPIPPFDPDLVVVPLASGRRRSVRGAVAAAVVLLAGVAGLVALQHRDGDPVVDSGPVRRFVAEHLPDGVAPGFLTSVTSSPDGVGAELYGPAPLDVRAVVSIAPDEVAPGVGFEAEGRPDWDQATFGDREGYVMTDVDLGWYGLTVVVDGLEVSILGSEVDRAALEQMASTVELAGGAVVADSPVLPEGWTGQGRVADMYGFSASSYGGGVGHTVGYMAQGGDGGSSGVGMGRSVTVSTAPGGVPDVAVVGALPLPGRERFEVTVRGRPGLLVHMAWPRAEGAGEGWMVAWLERPGEVIQVAGTGLDRDELLAVAESVRPAEPGEWERMERESLRNFPQALPGEVILGEGTFSTGHPWVLAVLPAESDGTVLPPATDETDTGSAGASIPSGTFPQHQIRVRTTASTADGVSGSHTAMGSGDEADEAPFPDGISVETGDTSGWTFGLVGPTVATVELVGPNGVVLATTEVLAAEDLRGFLIELPSDVLDRVRPGSGPIMHPGPTTQGPSGDGEWSTTTVVEADPRPHGADPSLQLVARAGDGIEVERHPLP